MTATPSVTPNQNPNDGFTPVKLKDGTTIKLKGSNLNPQQVAAGVAKFRASQSAIPNPQPPAVPVKPPVDYTKENPITAGAMQATGFDPQKVYTGGTGQRQPYLEQTKEMGREFGANIKQFGKDVWKDPIKGIASPIRQMALSLEFHTGRPWLDSELKARGIDETAIDEIKKGFQTDDHHAIMHGSGRLIGALGNILGAAEAPEVPGKIAKTAVGTAELAGDVNKARNTPVMIAAANETLKKSTTSMKQAIGDLYKQTRDNGVAKLAQNIAKADEVDSRAKGNPGSVHAGNISQVIDQTVKDKNAGNNLASATVDMSGTKMVKAALDLKVARKGPFLSWDDLKDVRGVIDEARRKSGGKDLAVLGDLQNKFTKVMRQRAAQLGKLDEFDEYTNTTKALTDFKDGILTKLDRAPTGLSFFDELSKESNRPQLNDLFKLFEKHGGAPSGFLDDVIQQHKPIVRLAKLSEGSSIIGQRANRMTAIMTHPIMGTAGGMAGGALGYGVGALMGHPLLATFLGTTVGAVKAAYFMDKLEAAKAIRELGGPDGVFGRPGFTGNQSPFGPSGGPTQPPQRPAGPGLPPSGGPASPSGGSPSLPAGPLPSGNASKGLSPALQKLVRPPEEVFVRTPSTSRGTSTGEITPLTKELHAEMEKRAGRPLSDEEANAIHRSEAEEGMDVTKADPSSAIREEHRSKLEAKGRPVTEMKSPEQKQTQEMLDKIKNLKGVGPKQEVDFGIGKMRFNPAPVDLKLGEIHQQIEDDIQGLPDAHEGLEGHAAKVGEKVERYLQDAGIALRQKEKGLPDAISSMKKVVKLHESGPLKDPEMVNYFNGIVKQLESVQDEYKGPRIVKASSEARGREASARTGMTKDTLEARRAKARERIAAKREEAGRTQQKASLEDQARQLAGKVTPQSLKSVPLVEVEEAAKEFDHTQNKMIWKGLQKLKKSQGWSEDVYRGYLEDFILKSIDMKSKMP